MRQTTRSARLLVAGALTLALVLPAVTPRPAHAGAAAPSVDRPWLTTSGPSLALSAPQTAGVAATVPITLQPPAGNTQFMVGHATGVQIYTCTISGTTFAWSSSVPAATLYDEAGVAVATHYAGPTWQAGDGSTVVGSKLQSYTASPDAIPWLLLSAKATTTGPTGGTTLTQTSYIQRLQTRGGLTPPASACTADTVGTTQSVPYSAIYHFFDPNALLAGPLVGPVGQTITVTGARFLAGETVQVYWDVTGTTPLATPTADGTGSFVSTLSLPAGIFGLHALIAIGQSSGTTAFAYVQETPQLLVTPNAGAPGSTVVATGSGFGASEPVNVNWNGPAGLSLGTTASDIVGGFGGATAVTVTVPLTASVGVHTIYAAGQSSGARAVTSFTVQ